MKLVKIYSNERISYGDTLYSAVDSFRLLQGDTSQIVSQNAPAQIISGFAPIYANTVVSVSPGRALLTFNDGDELMPGLLVTETAAPQNFSCASLANGVYTIFLTFQPIPTDLDSRSKYQGGTEGFDQNYQVYTRQDSGYSVTVAQASPGPEWLPIGTVSLPDGTVTDQRSFLFEGSIPGQFANPWGSAADRADDRSLAPLPDLATTIAALKTAIEDIKGTRWWVATGASGTGGSAPAALGTYKGNGPPSDSDAVAGRAYYDQTNNLYYIAS